MESLKLTIMRRLGMRRLGIIVLLIAIVLPVGSSIAAAAPSPDVHTNLEGWANTAVDWTQSVINAGDGTYTEGQSIPFRFMAALPAGSTQTLTVRYDHQKSDSYFFDSLSSYDRTLTPSDDPCSGVTDCDSSSFDTLSIPTDGSLPAGAQVAGVFTGYNAILTSFGSYSLITSPSTGDQKSIDLTFTVAGTSGSGNKNVVIAFGGHLARSAIWGAGNGACCWPGGAAPKMEARLAGDSNFSNVSIAKGVVPTPSELVADFEWTPSCDGLVSFAASASGGTEPYTYSWSFGGTGQTPSHTFASAGDVTLTVTDGADTTVTVTKLVTPWLTPTVSIATLESTELTCADPQITLSVDEPVAGYTYQWYKGSVAGGNEYGQGVSVLVSEADSYYVVAIDGHGCQSEPDSVDITGGCTPEPGLDLTKTVDVSTAVAGQEVHFTITIDNTGETDLTNVKLTDALLGLSSEDLGTIAKDGYWEDTYTYTVTADDAVAGYVLNTATAVADEAGPDSDSAYVDVLRPGLNITKVADRTTAELGDEIEYTITVTNNGEGGLTGGWMTDTMFGGPVDIGVLAGGASWSGTYTHAVTAGDVTAGEVVNTATAGSDQTGEVSASCTVSTTATPPPPPPPPPCPPANVSALIYGGWNGIPVQATVGGTPQDTLYTAPDSSGAQAVLWAFDPGGATWTVVVTPQLPGGLDPAAWKFEPASASVSLRACHPQQVSFQLVNTQPGPAVVLPVTGAEKPLRMTWWQALFEWFHGLFS